MSRDPESSNTPLRLAVALVGVTLSLAPSPLIAARWFVPGAAHSPGAGGANWRTDLILANPGSTEATAFVRFLPAGADNSVLPDPVPLKVPAGGQVVSRDLVGDLLHRAGSGALLVESSTEELVVTSRTYDTRSEGTFGTMLPGIREERALPPGETGHLIWAAGSASLRTNVGFAGTTDRPGNVTLEVYGASGQLLGSVTRSLPPYGQAQVNDVLHAVGAAPTAVARVEVTGTCPLVAFASAIDQQSGDPFATVAQRVRDGASELVLASSAHADGAAGSRFRTDLRLFNLSGGSVTAQLSFYPRGETATTPETVDVPLQGGELKALDDVLLSSFGKESAAGGLTITSPRALLAVSRTYTLSDEGSAGLALPAVSRLGLIEPDDIAFLPLLSDSGFRTNLLFFQVGPASSQLLTLRGRDGQTLASREHTVPADSMQQIDDVFGWLGVPGGEGSLEVQSTGGDRYWVAATVIDELSNDALHVGPDVRRALPEGCVSVAWPWGGLELTYAYDATSPSPTTVSWAFDRVTETTTNTRQSPGGIMWFNAGESYRIAESGPLRGFRELTESWGGTLFSTRTTEWRKYSPPLVTGPAATWCPGATWLAPSVELTVIDPFYGGYVTRTAPESGVVVAVNEPLTLPLVAEPGTSPIPTTLRTVHRRTTRVDGIGSATTDTWISIEHGVVVKEVRADAAGQVSTTLLTAFD